jgi:protein disulfide-isomerase-like protein
MTGDVGVPAPSDVVTLTSSDFKDSVKEGLWLVEFFAPWCGHCQQLAPIYSKGATALKGKLNFAAVDAEANDDLRVEFGVSSFPSIKLLRGGELREDFEGERTVAGFEAYYEKVKDMGAKPASVVQELTTSNFDSKINVPLALVKFYAPWCGHCKALAPTWELLATKLHPDVLVAKVDVTVHNELQSRFNVGGFPSIQLFKHGRPRGVHQGGRTAEAITEWMNEASGSGLVKLNQAAVDKLLSSTTAPPTFVLIGGTDADEKHFAAAADVNFREGAVVFAKVEWTQVAQGPMTEKLPRSSNSEAVVVVVNSGEINAMDRTVSVEAGLSSFIENNKEPYFYEAVTPGENFNEVMYSDKLSAVIHVADKSDPVAEAYLATFKKVAVSLRGSFVFGAIDAKKHSDLSSQIGMFPEFLPQLCVFNGKSLKYYSDQKLGRSEAEVKAFLEKVLAGGVDPKAPGDEKQDSPPAKKAAATGSQKKPTNDKLYDAGTKSSSSDLDKTLDKHEKILEQLIKRQKGIQEAIYQIRDEIIDLRTDIEPMSGGKYFREPVDIMAKNKPKIKSHSDPMTGKLKRAKPKTKPTHAALDEL